MSTALTMVDGIGTTPTITGTEVPTQMCASGGSGATAANWYKYSPLLNYSVTIATDFPANSGSTMRAVYSGSCGSLTCGQVMMIVVPVLCALDFQCKRRNRLLYRLR
ncbi:MAG: hypothetical protein IPO33_20325 [Saprospiraceae bacterium]|nr:hypothetical protein [Candidatus Brachybacter algidus]